ncbi:hypothetical protein E3E36_04155 [Thermococcus sp. M36]|uniref:hypothetical protein n=1 Tax=Thermococcus sp. M36 TaxID=1638261 RepID=UPI00143C0EBD|nr:hypothetical protein [Thermococcus sp. M36]NJE05345.1 hypothetical protein [Thermococcus sp. M36]
MTSYGFYSTQGVLLRKVGKHSPSPEIVPFADKYHIWASLVLNVLNGSVEYYVASRFDYVKEPFGRFSRGVLVVRVRDISEIAREFLISVKDLFNSGVADFSHEAKMSAGEGIEGKKEALVSSVANIVEEYLRGTSRPRTIADIPFRQIAVGPLSDVGYPPVFYRWVFLEGVRVALEILRLEGASPLDTYEDAVLSASEDVVYPLFNYARSAPTTLGGLWLVSSSGVMPHE